MHDVIPFTSLLACDVFMHLSDAVLSGGVRRSAMNILIDPDDQDLLHAKTGNWRHTHPWRARSNNAVGLMRHTFSLGELRHWLSFNRGDNDLGLALLSHEDDIFNPCYEIGFNFYDRIRDRSESVFQFCNLNEINASACVDTKGTFSAAKFHDLCRKAAILGTLQAGYTNFPVLGRQTADIVAGEALLGISVTGWMCRPELFDEAILTRGAEIVTATNREVASMIGIRPAARTTTVKPSGNASVVLQTSPGIHPEHARRYFRIMQLSKQTPTARYVETHHPEMLEPSRWSATGSDYAVFVPCENADDVILKRNMQGVRHLERIRLVRRAWVEPGKTEGLCYRPGTSHNVSNTVIVDDEAAVTKYLFDHQDAFTAVSFIAPTGDKDYVQAPYTRVMTEGEWQNAYGDVTPALQPLMIAAMAAFDGNLWTACDALGGSMPHDRQDDRQTAWLGLARERANESFGGDLVRLAYALKDRYLLDKWNAIEAVFTSVPDLGAALREPMRVSVQQTNALACHAEYCDTDIPPREEKIDVGVG
jgi:ribonucleoside-diphosphate reductase alpha chain